ncbi:MAG: TonB family protein [Myxococcales bacterium]|nr:TonB family protein [Myxococcales bacterium]
MHAEVRTHPQPTPLLASSGEALCVRVRWGNHRVATHVLDAGLSARAVTLGAGAGSDVVLPRAGRARFRCAEDGFVFFFTDGLSGEVLRNGDTRLSLDECISRGLAWESDDGWLMRLGGRDAVRLEAGSLSVEAFRIRRPRRALASLDEALDYRFLNVLLVCGLLGAVLLTRMHFVGEEGWGDEGPTRTEATRIKQFLVKPAEAPKKVASAHSGTKDVPKKGIPTKDGTPKRTASPPRAGGGADAREMVRHLFGGLGNQGVFGGGGLGKELSSAVGTMVGNSDGLGGLSLRGSSAGGPGGELVGIGGIARPGAKVGEGVGQLCPPGKTCKKQEPIPTWDSDGPIVCGGTACLDKELIRRVIRSHLGQIRYCYEAQLVMQPNLSGKVAVTFHVPESGLVDTARVSSSTVPSPGLEACLVSRVRTWRFPSQKGGSFVVTYPFLFKTAR